MGSGLGDQGYDDGERELPWGYGLHANVIYGVLGQCGLVVSNLLITLSYSGCFGDVITITVE